MARINDFVCILWTLCTVGINLSTALTGRSGCSEVRVSYTLNPNEVPEYAIPGDNLRVCPANSYTCCTPKMETKLKEIAETDFEEKIRDKTSLLRDFFSRRTQKFDDYMKELIKISERDLNNMFINTYGHMYSDNDEIFEELFDSLENYYYGTDIDLEQVMDDFFFVLFQRMFQLMNSKYEYTNEFWECTGHYIEELRPFHDIPQMLTVKVRRSLTAARTFLQGLGMGRDVVIGVSMVEPSASCLDAITRMSQCAMCTGEVGTLPCYSFCQNVMKGCLSSEAELQQEWNKYVDAMSELADRLIGPFNVYSVMTAIDLDISNAIMNMQGHGATITPKVMQGCGPLQEKRTQHKRSTRSRDSYKRKSSTGRMDNLPSEPSVDLRRLLKDVKTKLKEWERIWSSLSYEVCNDPTVAADTVDEENCWNGNTVGRYPHEQVGIGIAAQVSNPEVTLDYTKPNFQVRKQIAKLRTVTQQLKNAVAGKDADWIYREYLGSGSGSGSGSGDGSDSGANIEDPKYRPTVKPPGGSATMLTCRCLTYLLVLLAVLASRW